MLGTDIALKHQVSNGRVRDFLAESERQRAVDLALSGRTRRTVRLAKARAAVATLLIRAGSSLMPAKTADSGCQPAVGVLGLRLGR